MTQDEIIRMAREALEAVSTAKERGFGIEYAKGYVDPVITALREALAEQAEQEPVGVFANVNALTPEKGARWEQMIDSAYDGVEYIHLYAAPVRTKDLTDVDIHEIINQRKDGLITLARAVIAADRKLNGETK